MNNNSSFLRVGHKLSHNRYKIERFIASGGFGNTYEAIDLTFNEQVAIKELFVKGMCERNDDSSVTTINDNVHSFVSIKEKFKKEALRLRQIHHENIVSVRDMFEENGTAYYVMDYLEGESLAHKLLKQHRPMNEEELNSLLPCLLSALECIHKQNIWHLDLKPANIMIDNSNHPYLIDFGASKQVRNGNGDSLSTSSSIVLTLGFAPNEQMEQNIDKFGPWTDFYSLGATIYFCLTLKIPPMPSDIAERGVAALPLPEFICSKYQHLIKWLLEPNRIHRPQSVKEIKNWLKDPSLPQNNDGIETVIIKNKTLDSQEKIHFTNKKKTYIGGIVITLVIIVCSALLYNASSISGSTKAELSNTTEKCIILTPSSTKKISNIYKLLKENNDTKAQSFEDFVQLMNNSKYRLQVYEHLKSYGVKGIGNSYTEFCKLIGLTDMTKADDSNTNYVYVPSYGNLRATYNLLDKNGALQGYSFDEFVSKMSNKEFRLSIYGTLRNWGTKGIGNGYDEFCYYMGYSKIDRLIKRRMSIIYECLKANGNPNCHNIDDFMEQMENEEFCKDIYNKMVRLDVYGIGENYKDFKEISFCKKSFKGNDVDYESNIDHAYNYLVENVNYGNSKDFFKKYLTDINNINFQQSIFSLLKENGCSKYTTFQMFQSSMHPGLLE